MLYCSAGIKTKKPDTKAKMDSYKAWKSCREWQNTIPAPLPFLSQKNLIIYEYAIHQNSVL